jgi:hypothetical protein
MEETLTTFGIAGRGIWLAPRCERTVVKFVSIVVDDRYLRVAVARCVVVARLKPP